MPSRAPALTEVEVEVEGVPFKWAAVRTAVRRTEEAAGRGAAARASDILAGEEHIAAIVSVVRDKRGGSAGAMGLRRLATFFMGYPFRSPVAAKESHAALSLAARTPEIQVTSALRAKSGRPTALSGGEWRFAFGSIACCNEGRLKHVPSYLQVLLARPS